MSGRRAVIALLVTVFATLATLTTPLASAVPARSGLHFGPKGVAKVTARYLGKSWHHGCPVPPRDLRALRVSYWGFDDAEHTGVLVINRSVVGAVRKAFAQIEAAHFPIRQIQPVSVYGGSDNKSMAHDNTSAFNCRYAVASGPKTWSAHAYGGAIDIDPRENPYRFNGKVLPPSGAKYADRSKHRRGMIFLHGPVVKAFDAIGWGWGGRWSSTPDYQHFSVNGR